MLFEFNPFTGNFDIVDRPTNHKTDKVVDAGFLTTPEITLDLVPDTNSEKVSLNGLEIDDSNYTIVANVLIMNTSQLLAGDIIYVSYTG